ncbi:uncharacterized protein LTR77_006664 [Saxophila tyrrhenica]|uniref:Zn(2)-C6 fungal-type domain-containing protein n=1 Tax=Saxophila tyrrhenica TaxID=1690608 RepID=A0AAV9P603_9PEZI|nr:hypothetical protein LTR77_006664 [Saxophila tyrrhenica]
MTPPKVQTVAIRQASNSPSSSESPPESNESGRENASTSKETKKKRTSKPKVRSGCVTCKIRRIKCDETKPECNRCTSTGRKCDGYVIKPRKKRSDFQALNKVPTAPAEIGPVELRSLGFFHHKTAPSLSSYFDAEFWTRLVFQMSYVEPSVRHAMVALGALHEEREREVRLIPIMPRMVTPNAPTTASTAVQWTGNTGHDFALAQYNKSIILLSKRMDTGEAGGAIEVALLTCILFVCIEFLQGDSEPAVKHFRSGMGIALNTLSNNGSRAAQDTLDRIREYILPFFNRIELLANLFGEPASWDYPVELQDTVPEKFNSMRDARDSIVHIANQTVRFIKFMKWRKYTRLVLPDHIARQEALLRQMDLWSQTLDRMLLGDNITQRDLDAAKTLRIHQVVAGMWVKRCTMPEESANDECMQDFETTVSLAEAIQGIAGTREQRLALNSSSFLFDMEIVSPLYYVATKCRHPLIRRRAIAVLKQTQRREGLWDSDMASAVAERQMALEEVKLTTLDGSELPAEEDRVHNIQITSEKGIRPRKHFLNIHTRPEGPDGPWKIWRESLTLP